jgi:hypothetical protein
MQPMGCLNMHSGGLVFFLGEVGGGWWHNFKKILVFAHVPNDVPYPTAFPIALHFYPNGLPKVLPLTYVGGPKGHNIFT